MLSPRGECYRQKNNGVLLVGVLLLILSMARIAHAQQTPPYELKHFKMVGTIRFDEPDTLLIARIEQIDVDSAGRLLVTDALGEQVLLFDSTGALLASLDPRTCHPGFNFRPQGAKFGGDDFIIVLNSNAGQYGYRFTTAGACLSSVDPGFYLKGRKFFDIDPAGALYGAYDWPDLEMRYMSATGKTLMEFPIPPSKYPNYDFRFSDGGLIADGIHLFYARASEPGILKFALDGTLVGRISEHNSWFGSPRRDVPRDVTQFFEALKEWSGTTTLNIFELTNETLMAQYVNRSARGTGYQVFTKDGTLVAQELGIDGPIFTHGENGLVYLVVQPDLDSQGQLPNPFLKVHRFVAP